MVRCVLQSQQYMGIHTKSPKNPITVARCVLQIAALRGDSRKRAKKCAHGRIQKGGVHQSFFHRKFNHDNVVAVRGPFSSFSARAECGMVFCPRMWWPLPNLRSPFDRNGFAACTSLRLFCDSRWCVGLVSPHGMTASAEKDEACGAGVAALNCCLLSARRARAPGIQRRTAAAS